MAKKYTNGEVTILWQPDLCIHSGVCVNGLPGVFKPNERPWITPENATSEQLVEQVRKCPSGALSIIEENHEKKIKPDMEKGNTNVEVTANGPLRVSGPCEIKMPDGSSQVLEKDVWLCRCGASANKPFCDGAHRKAAFHPDA